VAGAWAKHAAPAKNAAANSKIASTESRSKRVEVLSGRVAWSMKKDDTCQGTEAQSNHNLPKSSPSALVVLLPETPGVDLFLHAT
jgi:hypothetical protein